MCVLVVQGLGYPWGTRVFLLSWAFPVPRGGCAGASIFFFYTVCITAESGEGGQRWALAYAPDAQVIQPADRV